MIKKILPTMIGAALVGGLTPAVADITVFGHLDTSVDYVDEDQGSSSTNLNCNRCSLGFKGSEDLGNGLKAIFKLDFQFDMTERNNGNTSTGKQNVAGTGTATPTVSAVTRVTDSPDSITDRDQWLGLAGNFGQIRIGTISTVYKSHGAMVDPIYKTSLQGRNIGLQSEVHTGAGEQGQGRAENTFRYDSPSWNGLKVGAHYTLQRDTNSSSFDRFRDEDHPFGVGVEYKNGPFLVFADYITNDRGGDDDAYKLGGKYTFGNYALFGQYEFDGGLISFRDGTQGGPSGNKGDSADVWFLGASGTFGNNMLYAAYGSGDDTSGNGLDTDNGYDSWEIAGVHHMSKRTSVYLGYANARPERSSDSDIDLVSLGMKHLF